MGPRDEDAPKGYAPLETVERIHEEAKAFRNEQVLAHEKINERLLIIEHDVEHHREQTRGQLNAGARRFTLIEGKIEDHDGQLRPSVGKTAAWVASFIFALAGTIAAVVWQLSKYPDAESVERWQNQTRDSQRVIDLKFQDMQIQQVTQAKDIQEIKGAVQRSEQNQKSIEDKLDRVIGRGR